MVYDHQFHLALISAEFFIQSANSLKSKRSVITKMRERVKSRFNVSIAEIGFQDKWQRAAYGITMIGVDKKIMQKDLAALENLLREFPNLAVTEFAVQWM